MFAYGATLATDGSQSATRCRALPGNLSAMLRDDSRCTAIDPI
jgi:hypothetical protein